MKQLITFILCLAFITSNAQTDSVSTELTKERVYNDVKDAVKQIGEALKVGGEHVYEVLIKQQIAEAITWLVVLISSGILSYRVTKFAGKIYKEDEEVGAALYLFAFILSTSTIVAFFLQISSIVTGIVNPEYGAIKEILNTIK